MPLEEIAEYEKLEGSQLNRAKEVLAFEVTKLIHGEEEAEKAQNAANALFGTGSDTSNMPSTELSADNFTDGKNCTYIIPSELSYLYFKLACLSEIIKLLSLYNIPSITIHSNRRILISILDMIRACLYLYNFYTFFLT